MFLIIYLNNSGRTFPTRHAMEEIVFEEDPEEPLSTSDSSSDDGDLLHCFSSDSDYMPPSERYSSLCTRETSHREVHIYQCIMYNVCFMLDRCAYT